jgi:hypothetical protein
MESDVVIRSDDGVLATKPRVRARVPCRVRNSLCEDRCYGIYCNE